MTYKELIYKANCRPLGEGIIEFLIREGVITVEPEQSRGEVLAREYIRYSTAGQLTVGIKDVARIAVLASQEAATEAIAAIIDDVLNRETPKG